MATEVKLKSSSKLSNKDAVAVEAELNRIRALNGFVLKPRTVWENSIPEGAPLHDEFTWDDSEAAEKYRDEEARKILQHVVVVDETGRSVRAWHHVVVDDVSGYVPARELQVDKVLQSQVLEEIRLDLVSARKRLSDFQGFVREMEMLDQVIAGLVPTPE